MKKLFAILVSVILIIAVFCAVFANLGGMKAYKVEQNSSQIDFVENIPLGSYLYDEATDKSFVNILTFSAGIDKSYIENTDAINSAIDSVSKTGGGTVYVPEGVFEVSTIVLKDNVTLFVEGTLKSIDYETNQLSEDKLSDGVIYANGAKNITLCGSGRIEGQGATFCEEPEKVNALLPLDTFNLKTYIVEFRKRIRFEKKNSGRVSIIDFENCENVNIHNIELFESAFWTMKIFQSNDVSINNVVINNNYHVSNTDGIDLCCCQNVKINHCYIATGDDGICIKADGDEDIANITVKDCKIMSLANCFKIGTTVYRNVKNINVTDCEFFMNNTTGGYAGISIQSDCGGIVSNIKIDNIRMFGISSVFLLWLGDRNGLTPGELKDISISNIVANDVELPSAITGTLHDQKSYNVKNVILSNIDMIYRDSQEKTTVRNGGVLYNSMGDYPEITRVSHKYLISHELSFYWDLPVCGLFVRNTANITVENFSVIPRSANNRPCDNITNEADRLGVSGVIINN